jgi:UDP-N-acetylglucosamine--N-acetylmuramyl-(pentapeptide) pyrophosphoryl-undecaprenol N-acetylglucosamine transferase
MAEVAARRIPAVVVPYPHAAAHQEANTRPFVDAGAAIMVPDAELSGERLAALVRTLLGDEQRRQRMAEAAEALSQPNAADAIADIAISLARHRSSRP